jgi:hypothetical protein
MLRLLLLITLREAPFVVFHVAKIETLLHYFEIESLMFTRKSDD